MAAAAVVVSHSFLLVYGSYDAEPLAWTPYTLGQHAVNVFFVLSGLMLNQSFAAQPDWIKFAAARMLRIFFGESQFSRVRDGSKIASAALNCPLSHWSFALRDAKWMSGHLAGLGFTTLDRQKFSELLQQHASRPGHVGIWDVDEALDPLRWAYKTPL